MATLTIWTIFQRPADFPQTPYVVRGFSIPGPTPADQVYLCDSLDQARASVPVGLSYIERSPDDEPMIVESWL